jgi:hypothetical protein
LRSALGAPRTAYGGCEPAGPALHGAEQHGGDDGDRDLDQDAERELAAGEMGDGVGGHGQALDCLQDGEEKNLPGGQPGGSAEHRRVRPDASPASPSSDGQSDHAADDGDDHSDRPVAVPGGGQHATPAGRIRKRQRVVGGVGDHDARRGDDKQTGPVGLHNLSVRGGRLVYRSGCWLETFQASCSVNTGCQ